MLRGREQRSLVLEENSSSSKAVEKSNAPESERTPWTVRGREKSGMRVHKAEGRKQAHLQFSPFVKSLYGTEAYIVCAIVQSSSDSTGCFGAGGRRAEVL